MENWRPPKPEEIVIGLKCEIIDMAKSADAIQIIADVKKHFKRDIAPNIIYKSHTLTDSDVEKYKLHPELINRDIRILE